jgi:hypothetical protein
MPLVYTNRGPSSSQELYYSYTANSSSRNGACSQVVLLVTDEGPRHIRGFARSISHFVDFGSVQHVCSTVVVIELSIYEPRPRASKN